MPKVTGTRKQKAQELLERLRKGPSSLEDADKFIAGKNTLPFFNPSRGDTVQDNYRNWFNSWVEHQFIELIPELRKK